MRRNKYYFILYESSPWSMIMTRLRWSRLYISHLFASVSLFIGNIQYPVPCDYCKIKNGRRRNDLWHLAFLVSILGDVWRFAFFKKMATIPDLIRMGEVERIVGLFWSSFSRWVSRNFNKFGSIRFFKNIESFEFIVICEVVEV
jgi:hypothetical protein